MPVPTLIVGLISILSLSDASFEVPPSRFMPGIPVESWSGLGEYLNDQGNVPLNAGCFLILEGGSWTLVDTGFGPRGGNAPVGKLDDELKRAQVTPDQIERVIITHLHGDHVGWNTIDRDGRAEVFFKNARHIVQRKDWDHFTQPDVKQSNPVIGLCVEPVADAGLLDLVDGDTAITAAITTIFTPGHTPGHQSVLVSSGGETAVILGDVTHTPAQVIHPDWNPGFDLDQPQSAVTRLGLFDRIEREGIKMAAGHYPYPSFGGIVKVNGGRRWQGVGQTASV